MPIQISICQIVYISKIYRVLRTWIVIFIESENSNRSIKKNVTIHSFWYFNTKLWGRENSVMILLLFYLFRQVMYRLYFPETVGIINSLDSLEHIFEQSQHYQKDDKKSPSSSSATDDEQKRRIWFIHIFFKNIIIKEFHVLIKNNNK